MIPLVLFYEFRFGPMAKKTPSYRLADSFLLPFWILLFLELMTDLSATRGIWVTQAG